MNELNESDLFANWLMDISETLADMADEVEVEADRYFNSDDSDLGFGEFFGKPAPIQGDQDLAAKKTAYLERLIGDLNKRLKEV